MEHGRRTIVERTWDRSVSSVSAGEHGIAQCEKTIVAMAVFGAHVHFFLSCLLSFLVFPFLFPAVHRLDRTTSGLLLLSLTRRNASFLSRALQEREVSKSYVARVQGKFPEGTMLVRDNIQLRGGGGAAPGVSAASAAPVGESGEDSADALTTPAAAPDSRAIAPLNPFMSARVPAAVNRTTATTAAAAAAAEVSSEGVSALESPAVADSKDDGKSAVTSFQFLSFDGLTSLVLCRPLSGRTHQLRVHLASVGHPIANDYLYGGRLLQANSYEDRAHRIAWEHQQQKQKQQQQQRNDAAASAGAQAEDPTFDEACAECAESRQRAEQESQTAAAAASSSSSSAAAAASSASAIPTPAPALFCHSVWLHCCDYSGEGWAYSAPLPAWAQEGFDSAKEMAHPVALAASAVGASNSGEGVGNEDKEEEA